MTIILTRYLYCKDEVKYSLWRSLIFKQKNEDEALFWTYELYHSGFYNETLLYLWILYFDFYAALNPNLFSFLKQITHEWIQDKKKDYLIGSFIVNMMRREFSFDMFLINNETETEVSTETVKFNTENANFNRIATLLNGSKDEFDFIEKYENIYNQLPNTMFDYLTEIISIINTLSPNMEGETVHYIINAAFISKMYANEFRIRDSKKYIRLGANETSSYKTTPAVEGKSHKVLKRMQKYPVYLDGTWIFSFARNKYDAEELKYIYCNKWLYHAAFSPIWKARLEKYGGKINHEKKVVEFESEENEDKFNRWFYYNTDEQSVEIQNNTIGTFKDASPFWSELYPHQKCLFGVDKSVIEKIDKIDYFVNL